MVVRSFDSPERRIRGVLPSTRSAARPDLPHALRQRLLVVAPCTVEAVRHAGGWLFDRVMAGWDATVLVAEQPDSRPLRILGASTADLESALTSPPRRPRPQAIAVETGLYGSDRRVARIVREALDGGVTEVIFWGELRPAGLDGGPVQHRLSTAARAFKAQALAAADAPVDTIPRMETFREPPRVGRPPDLIPVS